MKSAYEKAMERLERESGPTARLTDEQKARISDLDKRYDAMVAEKRLAYEDRLVTASSPAESDRIQAELASELADIEARRQQEREAVWSQAQG